MLSKERHQTATRPLVAGDHILTRFGDVKTIRWIGQRTVRKDLAAEHDLWPVRISKHALGNMLPEQDLLVSPNHRMLISWGATQVLFGEQSVLVAAKFLVGLPGITKETDTETVSYLHMLFDQHEIVISNGSPSESLYRGDIALRGVASDVRDEIYMLFPELEDTSYFVPLAAPTLKSYEAAVLITQT